MPIYEYYCAKCNVEFEALRPLSKADEPMACKTCNKPGRRQLSTVSVKSNTFTAPKLKRATKPRRADKVDEAPPTTSDA